MQIVTAETGKELVSLRGHEDFIESGVFSPDGKRVVTTSLDKTARIWEAETGKELTTLKGHSRPVVSAAFSRDGKRVVTTSEDKTARIWPVDPLAIALKHKPRDLTPDEMDAYEIGSPSERETYRRQWEARYGHP